MSAYCQICTNLGYTHTAKEPAMNKHIAPKTIKTVFIELAYQTEYGANTPDRNGLHRAEDAEVEAQVAA